MPKKTLLPLLLLFTALTGCYNKPELDIFKHQVLSVYPNPTLRAAEARVDLPVNTAYTLKVYDAKGKIFFEESVPAGTFSGRIFPIDLTEHTTGQYQVILEYDNTVTWQTLIKIEE